MAVVIQHCLYPLQAVGQVPWVVTVLAYTPLALFFSSYQAVLFFFILSGFVLAIPFYGARGPSYRGFVIKRIFRIYPVLWAALALAFVSRLLVQGFLSGPRTSWPNGPHAPGGLGEGLQQLLLVVAPRNDAYDGVIWSLVHEMRISLILPLIAVGIARGYGRRMILYGLPIAAVGFLFGGGPGTVNAFGTLYYGYLFIWGAVIAFHRIAIGAWISRLSHTRQLAAAATGIALYLSHSSAAEVLLPWSVFSNLAPWTAAAGAAIFVVLSPWMAAAGAAIFLVLALGASGAKRLLQLPPIQFLGRISYSLYLIHGVILYTLLARWEPGSVSLLVPTLLLTPTLSVAVAWLLYETVERRGIDVGHRMAARLAGRAKGTLEPKAHAA
jgi:peptidoglycan/LPS O-acetylase OafA/YrhL